MSPAMQQWIGKCWILQSLRTLQRQQAVSFVQPLQNWSSWRSACWEIHCRCSKHAADMQQGTCCRCKIYLQRDWQEEPMVLDADPGLPSCSMPASVQNPRCQKCTVESGSAARLEATVQFPDGSTSVQRVCWDHAACLCLEMQNGSFKLKAVKRLL